MSYHGGIQETVSSAPYGFFENHLSIETEPACLDESSCYHFVLFHKTGGVIGSGSGLKLYVDNSPIISTGPGDAGTYCGADCRGAYYWCAEVGTCS
jgi:hypothetical protein